MDDAGAMGNVERLGDRDRGPQRRVERDRAARPGFAGLYGGVRRDFHTECALSFRRSLATASTSRPASTGLGR